MTPASRQTSLAALIAPDQPGAGTVRRPPDAIAFAR